MKNCLPILFTLFSLTLIAQNNPLIVSNTIALPKDTLETKEIIASLNGLLLAKEKPNEENEFVYDLEKVETFILLDEMKGIEKSGGFKDDHFYKPYLSNVVVLEANKYLIQLSYIGIIDNKAILRASFDLIAHKTENSFVFASPLLRNTKHWKIEKAGNNIFHYQNTINKEKVKQFQKLSAFYDLKLKSTNKICDYYCCDNIIELQKLIGVTYKLDYNGRSESVWSSSFENNKLIVLGNKNASFDEFDTHDLFHDRLSLVIPRNKVNRPVDEGCAYLYSGSWGISWEDIFKAFKEQIASNKETDWALIKEEPIYFKSKEFNNAADYIVNALLIKKIEKEKGFDGVWELLNVGPFEKGNEKYYQTLEKLTGITKLNYNQKVWELINNEK